MKNTYFDESRGFDVVVFNSQPKAAEALAEKLHKEAVANNEAIDIDWKNRNYVACMVNEALQMLKDEKQIESIIDNYAIVYKQKIPS